jgi:hypothetical protein
MAQSFRSNMAQLRKIAQDKMAQAFCTTMLLASGQVHAQFLDKINNATALDSGKMLERAKTGSNNFGLIVQSGLIAIGLVFVGWGIFWIMSAGRSEGRKEAKPGWMMVIGGGALGGIVGIYAITVGAFAGLTA